MFNQTYTLSFLVVSNKRKTATRDQILCGLETAVVNIETMIESDLKKRVGKPTDVVELRPKKYIVDWSKTYISSGKMEITAYDEEEARSMANGRIGDEEGSMQYAPQYNALDIEEDLT